jgi:hypothetical protein
MRPIGRFTPIPGLLKRKNHRPDHCFIDSRVGEPIAARRVGGTAGAPEGVDLAS